MSGIAATRPETTAADIPLPSRRVVRAAYASALSATIGFVPLHALWGLGIPLRTDENKFRDWYELGGAPYLFVLSGLALMAGVLALSLVLTAARSYRRRTSPMRGPQTSA